MWVKAKSGLTQLLEKRDPTRQQIQARYGDGVIVAGLHSHCQMISASTVGVLVGLAVGDSVGVPVEVGMRVELGVGDGVTYAILKRIVPYSPELSLVLRPSQIR